MISNQNEKCLLKFISNANGDFLEDNKLLKIVCNLGINIDIENCNPVYEIINKFDYTDYKQLVRK